MSPPPFFLSLFLPLDQQQQAGFFRVLPSPSPSFQFEKQAQVDVSLLFLSRLEDDDRDVRALPFSFPLLWPGLDPPLDKSFPLSPNRMGGKEKLGVSRPSLSFSLPLSFLRSPENRRENPVLFFPSNQTGTLSLISSPLRIWEGEKGGPVSPFFFSTTKLGILEL